MSTSQVSSQEEKLQYPWQTSSLPPKQIYICKYSLLPPKAHLNIKHDTSLPITIIQMAFKFQYEIEDKISFHINV